MTFLLKRYFGRSNDGTAECHELLSIGGLSSIDGRDENRLVTRADRVGLGVGIVSLEDGSLLMPGVSLLRLADLDGDGAFSADETRVLYDRQVAMQNGHEMTGPSRGTVH